jgi:hypothetical protein
MSAQLSVWGKGGSGQKDKSGMSRRASKRTGTGRDSTCFCRADYRTFFMKYIYVLVLCVPFHHVVGFFRSWTKFACYSYLLPFFPSHNNIYRISNAEAQPNRTQAKRQQNSMFIVREVCSCGEFLICFSRFNRHAYVSQSRHVCWAWRRECSGHLSTE